MVLGGGGFVLTRVSQSQLIEQGFLADAAFAEIGGGSSLRMEGGCMVGIK